VFIKNIKKILHVSSVAFFSALIFPIIIYASVTDGTIIKSTSTDGYAWGENVGWINFGTTEGNVHITSSGLNGYAWDSVYGWINLAPTGSGVVNDGNGNLSGFAWSAGTGFIDFTGVIIDSSGKFSGQAFGATYGRLNFSCSTCNITTDWRPASTIVSNNPVGVGSALLIADTRSTTTQTQPVLEEPSTVFVPPIGSKTPPSQVSSPTQIPASTEENPINEQPVISQDGLPTVTPTTGKTFTTPSVPKLTLDMGALLNNLINAFNNFIDWGKKTFDKLAKLINTPEGSAITKSISTLGIVSALSVPLISVSFSDLWLMLLRFLGLLMGALGLKKKSRSWGTVYDSVTKRPLDPVYVSLINSETGKEVSSAITDLDGRYGFLVMPGKYKLVAQKTNYIQPSVKMAGKVFDEVYNDLYFGEELLITQEGQIISKNIPMDSLSFDWNEFAKIKMNVNTFMKGRDITWAKISSVIFFIGAVVAFVAVFAAPEPYNYIIAGIYVLAYLLNYLVFQTKKSGTLTEGSTGAPLSFAIISIFREGETVPLTKKIADKFGAYYALVPNGKYSIKIEKKNNDGSYSEIFNSSVVYIKSGVINENLAL